MKIVQKQIITALFLLVFLFGACSKDQRKVNKIEGSWKAISFVQDGAFDYVKDYDLNLIYKFEQCNLRSEEFCPLTIERNYPGEPVTVLNYGYRAVAGGKWIEYGKNLETNTLFGYKVTVLNSDELVLESEAEMTARTISFIKI